MAGQAPPSVAVAKAILASRSSGTLNLSGRSLEQVGGCGGVRPYVEGSCWQQGRWKASRLRRPGRREGGSVPAAHITCMVESGGGKAATGRGEVLRRLGGGNMVRGSDSRRTWPRGWLVAAERPSGIRYGLWPQPALYSCCFDVKDGGMCVHEGACNAGSARYFLLLQVPQAAYDLEAPLPGAGEAKWWEVGQQAWGVPPPPVAGLVCLRICACAV